MKKEWVRPLTTVQCFEADEYVAACGDSGTVYNFKCNAPAGTLYYYPNGTNNSAKKIGSFHPCPASHVTETTDTFHDGYIDYNGNNQHDNGESVIVLRRWEFLGYNYHATKDLDMDSWETAKS